METGLGSEEDTILYYRSLTSVEHDDDPVNGRCVNHMCIWVRVFKTKFHHGRSCKGGGEKRPLPPLPLWLRPCCVVSCMKKNVGRITELYVLTVYDDSVGPGPILIPRPLRVPQSWRHCRFLFNKT